MTAALKGVKIGNYLEAVSFVYDEKTKRCTGAIVKDVLNDQTFTVHAKQVV